MLPKLVAFDIDGTLVPDTTIARHMAGLLDDTALIDNLESGWHQRQVGHREFAVASARAYAGRTVAEMEAHAANLPTIGGAAEAVSALRQTGCLVVLATLSMAFAGRVLSRRLNAHDAGGTELEIESGVFTGRVLRFNDASAKAAFVSSYASARGIERSEIVAVGDSYGDIPMFEAAGRSIALNAESDVVDAADHSIRTRDLRDVLDLLL